VKALDFISSRAEWFQKAERGLSEKTSSKNAGTDSGSGHTGREKCRNASVAVPLARVSLNDGSPGIDTSGTISVHDPRP
jgi:hypothetical protein